MCSWCSSSSVFYWLTQRKVNETGGIKEFSNNDHNNRNNGHVTSNSNRLLGNKDRLRDREDREDRRYQMLNSEH